MSTPIIADARTLRDALLMARPATDHDGLGAVSLAQMIIVKAALRVGELRRAMDAQAAELAETHERFAAQGRASGKAAA